VGAVVITGAGRGLGRALAERLAQRGRSLALCARTHGEVDDVADAVRRDHGATVMTGAVDVADASAVHRFAEAVQDRLEVDGVVNNAAVLGPVGPFGREHMAGWERTLRVDLDGTAHVTAAFLDGMRARRRGSIVNLSGGGVGGPGVGTAMLAYVTAKFGVVGFTEALACELVGTGVRVNAVAPGAVDTGFTDPVLDAGPGAAGSELYDATLRNRSTPAPMGPYLDLVEYLLDEASSWLSGCLLSARWDGVEALESRRERILASSLLRLRRIDDDLFTAVEG
jgi:NAD(P)-dependent dehydrogenase (short-subunit alcohol dehydrogenase family)